MHRQRQTARRGRLVHAGFLLVTTAAVVGHAVLGPAAQRTIFLLIIVLPTVGVFVAMRANPAMDRLNWSIAATGLALQAGMQVVWPRYFTHQVGQGQGTLADLSIAGAHLFLLAAGVMLVRRHAARDPGGVIDAAIVGLCAAAPLWEWVLRPELQALGAPPAGQLVLLLDVLVLGGVLGSLARVVRSAGPARATLYYLLLALLATLAAITVAVRTAGAPGTGWQAELLIVAFLAFGAAPLHPAAAYFTAPDAAHRRTLDRSNLAFLGLALTVFPVIALAQVVLGRSADPLLFGIGSLITVPLVVLRLGQLAAQRERAERILAHHARHDELTGLLNRRAMLDEIDGAIAGVRDGRLTGAALLFCDLNGFKPINDRFGHQTGDRLLQAVAARLTACVRDGDVVGRFGGDEFVVLCRGGRTADVRLLAARVERAVGAPVDVDGTTVTVGVSVGTAICDSTAPLGRDALVSAADTRMYERKRRLRQAGDRDSGADRSEQPRAVAG